jgi:hypothetical protein
MVGSFGGNMKVGDLFRYIDTYDIHDIGVGSIGLIVGIPQRIESYLVIIGDKEYVLPFHHIEEVKCK